MISERMNSLFPPNVRKILMAALTLAGIFCLLLVRHSQDGTVKILWLYAMYICIMALVVLYKNSLNKYEIAIFCFLCIQLLSVMPSADNLRAATISVSYLLSYRYGISSRSLIATVIDFFTQGNFVSRHFVWNFILSNAIFLSFIISAFLGTMIQKSKNDIKHFLIFLSLLWLSCFTAPSAYFPYINFGRIEMFAIPILFLVMLVITKPVFRWIIPLLAVFVMATHLILVFFYIPFIVILLLHGVFEKPEGNRRTVFLLAATVKTILISFLCYLLLREGSFAFENARAFHDYLITKTDLNFTGGDLHSLMFASLEDHLIGWRSMVNFGFFGNLSILINIPLVFLFVIFWIKCFHKEAKKLMKLFYLIPIFTLLYQSVAFFLFWDFARWMIMVMNVQFLLVFYLIFVKNKTVLSVAQAIVPFIKRNAFFIILVFLLMTFFGPLRNIAPSDEVRQIIRVLTGRF